MSILQKLSDNKIGVGLAAIHWFIVLFVILSIFLAPNTDTPSFTNTSNFETHIVILVVIVVVCYLPALLSAALIYLPIYVFAEDSTDFWKGVFLVNLFTVTFQWLFVGKIISNFFNPKAAKPISLFLND